MGCNSNYLVSSVISLGDDGVVSLEGPTEDNSNNHGEKRGFRNDLKVLASQEPREV